MKEGSVYFPLFFEVHPRIALLVSKVSFATSPTGSPFGYHPRLSMVCPRWGQWIGSYDFY